VKGVNYVIKNVIELMTYLHIFTIAAPIVVEIVNPGLILMTIRYNNYSKVK